MKGITYLIAIQKQKKKNHGFTIIELLVIVVIIGILAAIVIIAYAGVQQRTTVVLLDSDLNNTVTSLGIINAQNGQYPSDQASAHLSSTDGTVYQYTYIVATNSYCLTAINGSTAYMATNSNTIPQAGVCFGHIPPGGITPNGGATTTFAGSSLGALDGTGTVAQFYYPEAIAIDSLNNMYVTDRANNEIRKVTSAGVVTTIAGATTVGNVDGTGSSARFNIPYGVVVSVSGDLYVTDSGNNTIRKVTTAGVVTTFAGDGLTGYIDATGTAAELRHPFSITVDPTGNFYVTDRSNYRIRKITSAGVVTTLAGSGTLGSNDGTGTAAQFNYPQGIVSDSTGTLYVVDQGIHRIRKIQ